VDCVVHVGTQEIDPFLTTVHRSRTGAQVLANAGSRYAPAAPLVGLTDLLEEEQTRFAFVGKPCDIAALRAYEKLNPGIERRIVFLISFFCAGTPSILATYDLVRALGVNRSVVRQFRYRGFGWPGRATAVDVGGQEYSMSYDDSWGRILGPRLQFRCKICPDGVGELADIVFGDAWHLKDGRPSFEERPGRSLILARTAKGERLLAEAESAGYLETAEFDLRDLAAIQPYQRNRRRAIAARLLALRLVGRPVPRYEGFHLFRNAADAGVLYFLKQSGGMFYRLVRAGNNPDS
jgi:coenzyme F420 hydrogenase subunit beta